MAARGLDHVFDYFVSPEEQREARSRSRTRPSRTSRCALVADADRPLSWSLAVDLARGLAARGRARILSPFSRPSLLPVNERLDWERIDVARTRGPGRPLQHALETGDDPTLVIVPPAQLSMWATDLIHASVRRLVLPVDPSAQGATSALALLRAIEPWSDEFAIGALVVGARSDEDGEAALRQLTSAAGRQLDIDVEELGALKHDTAYDRALLAGRTLLDLDHESHSARTLVAVCARLSPSEATRAAGVSA